MRAVAEFGENPYFDPRGQYSLSTSPGEVPGYRPKLFLAHGKEDHVTLRPPPVFPARVTSSVPSQAPLEWPSDVACALKHVRRLLPVSSLIPIKADPATSTSYLKVVNVPLLASGSSCNARPFTRALLFPLLGHNSTASSSTPPTSCRLLPAPTPVSCGLTFQTRSLAPMPRLSYQSMSPLVRVTARFEALRLVPALLCAPGA
jgi:hypothetical protein